MKWIQNPAVAGDPGKHYVTDEKAALYTSVTRPLESRWAETTAPDGIVIPPDPNDYITQAELDAALTSLPSATPDATSEIKGKARVMAGTADSPLYPASRIDGQVQDIQIVSAIARTANVTTAIAAATPDATTSVKGKAVLLGGTADAPTVPWASLTGVPALALARTLRAVSTNTTAAAGEALQVDATSGNRTVTPPASPTSGTQVTVMKTDASTNTVTWSGTTNGDASLILTGRWAFATLTWDGTQWLANY